VHLSASLPLFSANPGKQSPREASFKFWLKTLTDRLRSSKRYIVNCEQAAKPKNEQLGLAAKVNIVCDGVRNNE
jgi:hypothetical protein